jgi:PEGA domain-containing protein
VGKIHEATEEGRKEGAEGARKGAERRGAGSPDRPVMKDGLFHTGASGRYTSYQRAQVAVLRCSAHWKRAGGSSGNPALHATTNRKAERAARKNQVFNEAAPMKKARMVGSWSVAIALLAFLNARPAAAQAAIEYGHVATGSSAGLTGLSNKIDSALSSGKKNGSVLDPDKQPGVMAGTQGSLEDANRRALEQSAGQNAATLSLKSVPAKAVVRIDGKPVGQTPLLMSLAPGTYKVEMEGPRMEFGKQRLDLNPKETREIELRLSAAPRYPSQIRLQ